MQNQLFRQKSIERISSPEQLRDYLRVTSPRLWMILAAIVALLVGFIVYASTTQMESTISLALTVSSGNEITGFVTGASREIVRKDMPVRISGRTGRITRIMESDYYRLDIALENGADLEPSWYFITREGENPGLDSTASLIVDYTGEMFLISTELAAFESGTPLMNAILGAGGVRIQIWSFTPILEEDADGRESSDPTDYYRPRRLGLVSGARTITVTELGVTLDEGAEPLAVGSHPAEIVTETTTPISFLLGGAN